MRIAVFGGRGFIGKKLVEIGSNEHELFLFNRPDADIKNPDSFSQRLKDIRPDIVINLAAKIGTMTSSVSVKEMFETNTIGSLAVAYAAHDAGARSYIFISSTVVHGENEIGKHHGRFSTFAPKHPYSASKASAEYGLEQFAREVKDMVVIALRPPMVIGEGAPVLLPPVEFVRNVLRGKDITILGNGLHEREYVSVADTASGVLKAAIWGLTADAGYHPFFLTGNRISMRGLAERVVNRFGGKITYVPKTARSFSLTTDPYDSQELLGWQVSDGIDSILDDVQRFVSSEQL